jgi:hypothetical protein
MAGQPIYESIRNHKSEPGFFLNLLYCNVVRKALLPTRYVRTIVSCGQVILPVIILHSYDSAAGLSTYRVEMVCQRATFNRYIRVHNSPSVLLCLKLNA